MIDRQLFNITESALSGSGNRVFKTSLDDWHSPCEYLRDTRSSFWRPIPQAPKMSFEGFERAIEMPIHEAIKEFYCSFWSGTLPGIYAGRPISLIQIWNQDDFDRLISNLVGHYLAQKRANIPFSVFIGTPDDDDELSLSLDNQSGKIFLERPGQGLVEQIAPSLTNFLEQFSLQAHRLDPMELPANV